MCIDTFCDARSGVAQNHPDGCLIDFRPVKERGQGMTALMRRMLHPDCLHSLIPEPPEAVIGWEWADCPGLFPLREYAQNAVMDGDFTNPSGRL